MKQYMPRPEAYEACSLKGLFYFKADKYPQWVKDLLNAQVLRCYGRHMASGHVELTTVYGVMEASYDDYIIKDKYGHIRLIKKDELFDTFDLIRSGGRYEQLRANISN